MHFPNNAREAATMRASQSLSKIDKRQFVAIRSYGEKNVVRLFGAVSLTTIYRSREHGTHDKTRKRIDCFE